MTTKILPRSLVASVAFGLASWNSSAHTNFVETFESGNLANWTIVGTQTPLKIANTNKAPTVGAYAAQMTNSSCRMYANTLPTGLGFTNDSFKFTVWVYDTTAATRIYNEVRYYSGGSFNNGALSQLLMVGKNNSLSTNYFPGEAYDGTKYQGRIAFGSPYGYFNLNNPGTPSRSSGWHKFGIERGLNIDGSVTLLFYVDGKVGRSMTNFGNWPVQAWDSVVIGPGLGTTVGDAYFDGVEVISGQPYISGHPEGQTNYIGQSITVTAYVSGADEPMAYQWFKGTSPIAGATSTTYTIANAQFANAGNYHIMASNSLGTAVSLDAYVQVNPLNLITVPPTNLLVNLGSPAVFYAEATGSGSVYYQWQKAGVNIPGATGVGFSSTYEIPSVVAADAGVYSVTVTNDLGDPPTTSAGATLTVNLPPSLAATTNQTVVVNTSAAIHVTATDDLSQQSTLLFQTFETNAVGSHTMFCDATFSGTTGSYLDTNVVNRTYVTNNFPAGHGSARVLEARWTWWSNSPPASLRLTTASGGVSAGANPIVSFTNRLRFDIYSTKLVKVALGLRESNPTGVIGGNAGASSAPIEWVGVGSTTTAVPDATNEVPAGIWTNVVFDPLVGGFASAYGVGNGALQTTTGSGTLEHLAFVPGDGLAGDYEVYLDNFVQMPAREITFALQSGPAGALIDPVTGIISWTPASLGVFPFTVVATDYYGLSVTNTFDVTVATPAPVVVLTSPANNATFTAPAIIDLAATVTPNGHTIDKVQFYNFGTNLIGETLGPFYTFSWTAVPAGSYRLTARAVYGGSLTADSAAANVTVLNPAQPWLGGIASLGGNTYAIGGTGAVGQVFVLQTATNLTPPVTWDPADTNSDLTGIFNFTNAAGTAPQLYYRVLSR